MPRLSPAQLAELRRRAFSESPTQLSAAVEASGLPQDLVSIRAASTLTGTSRVFIRRRIKRGEIHSWRHGWRHLISISELIKARDSILCRFGAPRISETRAQT